MSPERWPRNRPPIPPRLRRRSAAAPTSIGSCVWTTVSPGPPVSLGVDDVGDQAGDVVGAARLEAGADQLDGGVVGGCRWTGCRPAGRRRVRRSRRRCTAAAGRRAARSTRNRSGSASWTPSRALRIRLRCGWTRASSSVIRPSSIRVCTKVWSLVSWRDLAVAEQVGAAVADVADADPLAVEERDGRGGAGAVEGGVLVDQLADPVVGPVQGTGDLAEQVVGWASRRAGAAAGWRCSRRCRRGRRRRRRRRPRAATGRRTRSPGCPCGPGRRRRSRRTGGGDVIGPGLTSAARGSSCRSAPGCRG